MISRRFLRQYALFRGLHVVNCACANAAPYLAVSVPNPLLPSFQNQSQDLATACHETKHLTNITPGSTRPNALFLG